MEDNEPLASAAAKGRSSAPHLNFLLRKIRTLSVATGIKLYLPWVDTAHQTADELSRRKRRGLVCSAGGASPGRPWPSGS
eukprot:2314286-Pyramimonas_sp.AAC.1